MRPLLARLLPGRTAGDPNGLIVVLAVGAAVTLAVAAPSLWLHVSHRPWIFLAFVALTAVLQAVTVEVHGRGSVSFAGTGILAMGFAFGTGAAMWTGAAMGLVNLVARRGQLNRGVFDAAQWALSGCLAVGMFQLAGGHRLGDGPAFALSIATSVLFMSLNLGLLCTAMGLAEGSTPLAVWRERFRWFTPYYLVSGPLAYALTVAYERIGVLGLVAFALPPVMMMLSASQFVARTQRSAEEVRQANEELERANDELARANEAMRESEERFRLIFDAGALGIRVAGLDGRVLAANGALERMLGADPGGLTGSDLARITHPADAARHAALERELADGTRDGYELECRLLRTDGGEPPWCVVTASVVRDDTGRPELLIAMVQDVTERKQLEEQLRVATKMEALGRLAGGIAHDFNNLLTVVSTYSDFALRQLDAADKAGDGADGRPLAGAVSGALRRDIEEIRKAGERAGSLTQQLLAVGRRQMLQAQVLDLNAVVADTHTMLRRLIGEDIEVTTVLAPDLGAVRADRSRLEQVLLNLVLNARDAMPDGGRLHVETANVDLARPLARDGVEAPAGPYAALRVTDTGVGMDAATRARIFEPFFTTKEKGKGTGLGLSTVYGIVAQSGGAIFVSSEPGRGTRFEVLLPRLAEPALSETPPHPGEAPLGAAETVLLVEDEDLVRVAARRILRDSGYRVLEAFDGIEALRVAGSHRGPIHVLVTDVVMPRMGGPALVERLGTQRPELRVLYMSGYTEEADVAREVAADEAAFLQKPFTHELLTRRVRELLDDQGGDGQPAAVAVQEGEY